ncbi:MAG TPA: SprT-like domain-containing protein [bacterium]|mgnify:CR=1 FL=1|nr:SprT-like domain-containing protein [bacterium]HPO52651.1 SprT-like domain-containing protein [bacterium]
MIDFEKFLKEKTGTKIHIETTSHRKTLVQVITGPGGEKTVKIHHHLVKGPPEILIAIADFIAGKEKKKNRRLIIEYVKKNQHLFLKQYKTRINYTGKFYNLKQIFDKINAQFFDRRLSSVNITFGKRYNGKRHRSIVFGNYCPEINLIRINRVLDSDSVPEFFVEYIVFHEMLHAYLYLSDFKTTCHTKTFKNMEKKYPYLEQAEQWKRQNLCLFIDPKREKHVQKIN